MKMKYTKYVFVILLSLVIMISGGVNALAKDTRFSTEEMSQERIDNLLENIDLTFLTTDDPRKGLIDSFDVSETGMVAISHNRIHGRDNIFVYNSEGEFQYGYSLDAAGMVWVEFDNDNLIIYFVRSEIVISVDSNGEVQSVLDTLDTEENEEHLKYLSYLREKMVGDTKYSLEGFLFYTKVIATNASGEETVIYDATVEVLIDASVIAGIFLIGGIYVHKKTKRSK